MNQAMCTAAALFVVATACRAWLTGGPSGLLDLSPDYPAGRRFWRDESLFALVAACVWAVGLP